MHILVVGGEAYLACPLSLEQPPQLIAQQRRVLFEQLTRWSPVVRRSDHAKSIEFGGGPRNRAATDERSDDRPVAEISWQLKFRPLGQPGGPAVGEHHRRC